VDKRTIIGFILIGLVIILYPIYMEWIGAGKKAPPERPEQVDSTLQAPAQAAEQAIPPTQEAKPGTTGLVSADTLVQEKMVTVETDLYSAQFTSRGALLRSFVLKKYQGPDGRDIQIVPSDGASFPLDFEFPDAGIDLGQLDFRPDRDDLVLSQETPEGSVTFTFTSKSGARLAKKYRFINGRYDFKLQLEMGDPKLGDLGRKFLLDWSPGLRSTEKNRREDLGYFAAYSMLGTEMSEMKKFAKSQEAQPELLREAGSGATKWVATRTKYFVAVLMPSSGQGVGFSASGTRTLSAGGGQEIETKRIGVSLEMPLPTDASLADTFTVYVGPIDYYILRSYRVGLEGIVNLGWKIIRPFSIAILWLFLRLHRIIPNYGFVIILFTILMKFAFHPLTRKSTTATLKMQELQPKMAQLKEKYKKDPARLNQETMKLYKTAGVNPLGGCLPLLLQMPVFYGLFIVFRSTIELRGAKFVFWLTDLSQMDPYYVLPIIMAVAMFWQQKISIKDPKQAMLVYFMPVLFFFFFFRFPAGLTLYWTVFNILSLIETYYFKSKGLHVSSVSRQPAPASAS
jgi:YidC/Oxa1 family membrane protein insertase